MAIYTLSDCSEILRQKEGGGAIFGKAFVLYYVLPMNILPCNLLALYLPIKTQILNITLIDYQFSNKQYLFQEDTTSVSEKCFIS